MKKHQLEQYHKGDDAWHTFCELHSRRWDECSFQTRLVAELSGNDSMAKVIYSIIGKSTLEWINAKIPALDGLTPKQCIQKNLSKRLECMLMRMP